MSRIKETGVKPKGLVYCIAIAIVTVAFLMSATSCASRKVAKSETKEETRAEITSEIQTEVKTETEINTNIKEVTTVTTDVSTNKVTETKTIKPIDATKKSNYKGIEFENAEINESKTTDLSKEKTISVKEYNEVKKELENALKREKQLNKLVAELRKQSSAKQTEVERLFSYWWLIVVVGIAILIYRKYLRNWI